MVKTTNRKTKTYKKKRYTKPKFESKVAKIAQKILDKNIEDKIMYHSTGDAVLLNFNSIISSTSDYIQIIPNCIESVDENGRIGDKITINRFNVNGYIRFNPALGAMSLSSPGVCQVGIRMMILSLKKSSSWDLVTSSANPLLNLLRRGGTTVGYSGQIADLYNPINTDLFTVHHDKKFYMSQTFTGQSTAVGFYNTDISNQIKFFNFTMKCKKKVLCYDDGTNSGLLPTNYAPFMLIGYSYLNGQTADTVSANLGAQIQASLYYQDA